jgi:cytochrome c peroxidase
LAPMSLPDAAIADLVAFMNALTDPQSEAGRLGVPDRVPSGLPID